MQSIKEKVDAKLIIDEMREFGIEKYDILYDLNSISCIIVFSNMEDMHLYALVGKFKEVDFPKSEYEIRYVIYPDERNYYNFAKKKLEKIGGQYGNY